MQSFVNVAITPSGGARGGSAEASARVLDPCQLEEGCRGEGAGPHERARSYSARV